MAQGTAWLKKQRGTRNSVTQETAWHKKQHKITYQNTTYLNNSLRTTTIYPGLFHIRYYALSQSVGGCAMAQAVSRRLCHGSGSKSAVVPWLGRSVDGCSMARAVSRRLCHGSAGQSAAVPWLGRSFGGYAMARAVIRRPCHGSGSKASAAHRQCVWDLCWTKCQRGSFFLVLQYSRSVSFHLYSTLILSLILLWSEGQAVEAWEPSEEANNFQKWGRIRKKYFPIPTKTPFTGNWITWLS